MPLRINKETLQKQNDNNIPPESYPCVTHPSCPKLPLWYLSTEIPIFADKAKDISGSTDTGPRAKKLERDSRKIHSKAFRRRDLGRLMRARRILYTNS